MALNAIAANTRPRWEPRIEGTIAGEDIRDHATPKGTYLPKRPTG